MKNKFLGISLLILSCLLISGKCNPNMNTSNNEVVEWLPADLIHAKNGKVRISGDPQIVSTKYGEAVHFNGSNDGLFLDEMPIAGLEQFTVEVIFYPESKGNFEQRFFHLGEINGNRVLLELRATPSDWYFDAFIKSGNQQLALIEPKLLHPLDQWYHVAYIVDRGKLTTYVNGKKELEGQIELTPLHSGKISIGVRQNEMSWFKGKIYKIRISQSALQATEFLKL